jgi:hypothetical protein
VSKIPPDFVWPIFKFVWEIVWPDFKLAPVRVIPYRLLLTDVYCICWYIVHILVHPNKLVVQKVREKSGRLPAKLNIL